MSGLEALAETLTSIAGAGNLLTERTERRTYESDALTSHAVVPGLVVLPDTVEQVQAIVRACDDAKVPFVARGSGTGLSAGALPLEEGVLIVLSRLRRILDVDLPNRRVTVEPGVTNLEVTAAVSASGLLYAPDPSSQVICSIGGNVAENSGGAHCL
jgi:glycolate oxidase